MAFNKKWDRQINSIHPEGTEKCVTKNMVVHLLWQCLYLPKCVGGR